MDAPHSPNETAAVAFRNAYPIDFFLYNVDQQPVLYIDDIPDTLTLEIKNASSKIIDLMDLSGSTAGRNTHHFELCFRPGTLEYERERLPQITLEPTNGWQMSREKNPDGTISFFILSTGASVSLEPDHSISLPLNNLTPFGGGGTHGTRVELKYQNMKFTGSETFLSGCRMTHLALINHQGRKQIPLHVGFVGSNKILNDGISTNELTLRITNVLKLDPAYPERSTISLRGENSEYPRSELVFSFDSGNDDMNWALGTSSQVANISVKEKIDHGSMNIVKKVEAQRLVLMERIAGIIPEGTQFRIAVLRKSTPFLLDVKKTGDDQVEIMSSEPPDQTPAEGDLLYYSTDLHDKEWITKRKGQGEIPEWVLASDETVELRAGEFIQLTFESIVSSLPNGRTNLYVHYHNIPGYWDGNFTVPIEKSSMVFKDDRVGIGVINPTAKLDVAGAIQAWSFSGDNLQVTGAVTARSFSGDDLTMTGAVQARSLHGESLQVTEAVTAKSFSGDGTVPCGVIVMWHGSEKDIPQGWALCNGQNDTPNLVERFIMGAGSAACPAGTTGGASKVQLTQAQMPSHTHSAATNSDGAHDHSLGSRGFSLPVWSHTESGLGADDSHDDRNITTNPGDGRHNHTISVANTGNDQPHENIPPYYALCFIMKV